MPPMGFPQPPRPMGFPPPPGMGDMGFPQAMMGMQSAPPMPGMAMAKAHVLPPAPVSSAPSSQPPVLMAANGSNAPLLTPATPGMLAPPPLKLPQLPMRATQIETAEWLPPLAMMPMTVFVGKIPVDVDDKVVAAALSACGTVTLWDRRNKLLDSKVKLPFGYCKFANALGAMRALELVSGLKVGKGDGCLLCTVDGSEANIVKDAEEARYSHTHMGPSLPGAADAMDKIIEDQEECKRKEIRAKIEEIVKEAEKEDDEDTKDAAEADAAAAAEKALPPEKTSPAPAEEVDEQKPSGDFTTDEAKREKVLQDEIEKFKKAQRERDDILDQSRKRKLYSKAKLMLNPQPEKTETPKEGEPQAKRLRADQPNPEALSGQSSDPNNSYRFGSEDQRTAHRRGSDERHEGGGMLGSGKAMNSTGPMTAGGGVFGMNLSMTSGSRAPGGARAPKQRINLQGAAKAFGEEDTSNQVRTLVPIDYTDKEKGASLLKPKPSTANRPPPVALPGNLVEYGKDRDKQLVDRIPKDRDPLFKFAINWAVVEAHGIVDDKLRPWIVKKIVEYLGEEEETLIDFIITKLKQRSPPSAILKELKLVLDDDAEIFVLKLWRMLAFHGLKHGE